MSSNRNLLSDLNDLARIEPDVDAQQRAICRARSALRASMPVNDFTTSRPLFGAKIMRPRNLAVITATVAIIVITTHLLPTQSNRHFAFAQVQEQVANSKSVRYTEWKKVSKDDKTVQETNRKVSILGGNLRREEVFRESSPQAGNEPSWINVVDLQKRLQIRLFPKDKTYRERQLQLAGSPEERENFQWLPGGKPGAAPQVDFYELIRNVPTKNAQKLPTKNIDGKSAIGFRMEEKEERNGGTKVWQHTYWVDAATKLPLRIEASCRSHENPPNSGSGVIEVVLSNFAFDAPLDPALFSTNPPQGYTNEKPVDSRPAEDSPSK